MPKNSGQDVTKKQDYSFTQNRELSWLRFNRRVLEEAADESVPLLERLKFISIFSSNLDEFFMVRVGSLFDLSVISPGEIDNKTGETPSQQLESIYAAVPGLVELKDRLYSHVCKLLAQHGIREVHPENQTPEEKKFLTRYFQERVLPILSPQIVDAHHPFPHLDNKALYIATLLRNKKGEDSLGLVPIPASLPPFLSMPGDSRRYLRMESLLLQHTAPLFAPYKSTGVCVLCVTRNADLSFDEEKFEDHDTGDFRNRMSKLLKKRDRLSVMRLELSGNVPPALLRILKDRIAVDSHQIYFDQAPLNLGYVYALADSLPEEVSAPLSFQPYQPRWPADLRPGASMIDQIQQRDRMLFFPFDPIEPFLNLLSEAAERPDVVSIRITIYRLASASKIARILCRAAENGKEVTVLMELRARFDEANNISWSKILEESGCRILYGVEDFKCHSKLCLITLKSRDGLRYITQVGTGNYNEKTSALYTDLSLMTASQEIGADGNAFFRNMMMGNLAGEYHQLLVAPAGIKARLLELIDREIAKGPDGYICIKANSMTEREVIDKLAQASCAGVQIQLILRGICCLRPGIPGKTENIHVTSIVGRYLEHSRIYCFGRGEQASLYLSSADLMTRNLNRRVEIACPVRDPVLREQLLWILGVQLADNVKASALMQDGSYYRKANTLVRTCSQEVFMEQSIHRPPENEPENTGKKTGNLTALLHRLKARFIGEANA